MPAFSYKERFVPLIKDRTKRQTIRAFRKYLMRPGQRLAHFFGMRTKHCYRIIEDTTCTHVFTVFITRLGAVFLGPIMEKEDAEALLEKLEKGRNDKSLVELLGVERDQLAYDDGFRKEGAAMGDYTGCYDIMYRWWNQTHALPFTGQLIKW